MRKLSCALPANFLSYNLGYSSAMNTRTINTYLAILIVTLLGAGATVLIVQAASTTEFAGYDGTDPLIRLEAEGTGNR